MTGEAIAAGDFQGSTGLGGFFLQEEDIDSDGNAATSEGLFVFQGSNTTAVSIGDKVRVMETRPLSKSKRWRVIEILERAK